MRNAFVEHLRLILLGKLKKMEPSYKKSNNSVIQNLFVTLIRCKLSILCPLLSENYSDQRMIKIGFFDRFLLFWISKICLRHSFTLREVSTI